MHSRRQNLFENVIRIILIASGNCCWLGLSVVIDIVSVDIQSETGFCTFMYTGSKNCVNLYPICFLCYGTIPKSSFHVVSQVMIMFCAHGNFVVSTDFMPN